MANSWYVSNPLWNALPVWQASHTYTLGQIVRPATTFQEDNRCSYVITTAGTSGSTEPSWNTNNNGTTSDNGMVWTNVTGQSAYGWTAAAGSFSTVFAGYDIQVRVGQGDTVYVDSNNAETNVPNYAFNSAKNANTPVKIYSVNASGSVPPASADYLPGASFDMNNNVLYIDTNNYFYGLTFTNAAYISLGYSGYGLLYMKDCVLSQGSSQSYTLQFDNSPIHVILDNTQIIPYSGNTTNYLINFNEASMIFEWWNTSNPTNGYYVALYPFNNSNATWVHLKGIDLSVFTTTNCPNGLINPTLINPGRFTFENCYLGMPDVAVYTMQSTANSSSEQCTVELINCYAGTENYNNSRFTAVGQLLTKTDTTLAGGATDGLTSFSHQITTSSYAGGKDTFQSMDGFPIFFNNTISGTTQTAEIQVIAKRQLTSDDIRIDLDYMSSSSYPQSKTLSTNAPLQASTNLATTSSTWTTGTQPSYVSYYASAYLGNSYWTRTSDVLASFSGSSNPCVVFVNNPIPFAPCYMEFQNQTFSGNQVAIGVIRSNYSSTSDPRSEGAAGSAWIAENGVVVTGIYNGIYTLTAMTTGTLIRMYWDGRGNIAFAVNNGLWNGLWNDSQIVANGGTPALVNYMNITDIVPFVQVTGGSASSWKIASDVTNCTYTPPTGANYLPSAANTYIPQKMTLSFTAQNIGLARATVKVTSPICQVWVDPSVSLS